MACAKKLAYWLPEPNGQVNQADEEIRTLDPLLGKEMLYH